MYFIVIDDHLDMSSPQLQFLATPSPVNCCYGIIFISVEKLKRIKENSPFQGCVLMPGVSFQS